MPKIKLGNFSAFALLAIVVPVQVHAVTVVNDGSTITRNGPGDGVDAI